MTERKRNHGEIAIGYSEYTSGDADAMPGAILMMQTRPLLSVEDAEKYLRHEMDDNNDGHLVYYIIKIAKSFTVQTRRTLVSVGGAK